MPPVKPWLLKPKQSLGVFRELGSLLDKREGRQLAEEQRQQALEDRVFGSIRQAKQDIEQEETRTLEKAIAEERLKEMRAPKVVKPNRTYDTKRGVVIDLDALKATSLGLPADDSEPLAEVVGADGKVIYTPRSKAVGQQAPRSQQQGDKTLVQVQQPDGSVIYVPREQAIGQQAPGRAGAAGGGAEKAKRVQALANVADALYGFEQTLGATGSVVMPGAEKSTLQTTYENLQLQMKELFNLGVLNGPDLLLMRRVLNDPTDIKQRMLSGGSAEEQTRRTRAQIAEVKKIIARYQANLSEGNAAMEPRGAGPAPRVGAPPKVPSADPEFDALMAKYGKRP